MVHCWLSVFYRTIWLPRLTTNATPLMNNNNTNNNSKSKNKNNKNPNKLNSQNGESKMVCVRYSKMS